MAQPQTQGTGPDGLIITPEIEGEIAKAQVQWLKDLLIQIGPRKVLCGYEHMRLAVFIEQGLERLRSQIIFSHIKDDDIPF